MKPETIKAMNYPRVRSALAREVRRFAVIKERHPDDWYDVCKQFCEDAGKKPWSLQHVYNMMNYSKTVLNLGLKPTIPEKHVRPLTSLEPEVQKEIWGKISKNGDAPKPEVIKKARKAREVRWACG